VVGTGAALGGTDQDNNVRLFWDTTRRTPARTRCSNGDGDDDRDSATFGYVEAPRPRRTTAQDTVRVTVNTNVSGTVYRDADASGTLNGGRASASR
jgi:hypothetical protein